MSELTIVDQMLQADALVEYGIKHVKDVVLFGRALDVLRKMDYIEAADALERYRASLFDIFPESLDVDRIQEYVG